MQNSQQMQAKAIVIPDDYLCVITGQIMQDPVFTADGYTYEQEAIEGWLKKHDTTPDTNEKLEDKTLRPNRRMKSRIEEYLEHHPELRTEVYFPEGLITKLALAIKEKSLSEVKSLLAKDKRILYKSYNDSTFWHLACMEGSAQILDEILSKLQDRHVTLILETKVAADFKFIYANLLLEESLDHQDFKKAEMLLKLGADLKQVDIDQNTLLHRLIIKGQIEAFSWLLERKPNLDACNKDGNTPLHLAVINNNKAIVKSLIQAKTNLDAANIEGNTPLHLAAMLGNNEVIPLLLEAGANHKLRNKAYKIPVKLAIAADKSETVMLIDQTLHKLKLDRRAKLDKLEEIEVLRQKISQLEAKLNAEKKARKELCSSYELTRQGVAPLIVKADAKKALSKFLRLVAEGEQSHAESMLQKNPDLGLSAGDVTDLSKRSFNNITGFQYAVWALDYHMWTMLLKYLKPEDITKQLKNMETGSWVEAHGKSASWQILIDALNTYISLCEQNKGVEAATQWNRKVGDAQVLLPVHVVNEYCHPNRSFEPCPDFKDSTPLPRSRQTRAGEWFTAKYNDGTLGTGCFAYWRATYGQAYFADCGYGWISQNAVHDARAISTLLENRAEQQKALFAEYIGNKSQAQCKLK